MTSVTPPHSPLPPSYCAGIGWPDAGERGEKGGGLVVQKDLNGDLELPPVADPPPLVCILELYVWTVGGMEAAHTERRLL